MDNENTNEQPTLKQKKPRSEAQIAALEKARQKAQEMRAARFKNVGDNEPESEPEEEESAPTESAEPELPEPEHVAEKKPRKTRVVKPKAKPVEKEPEAEPKPEPEPEPERETKEVKEFRRSIQASPPPTEKQHFRMIRGFKKSYMLYEE